MDSRSKLKLYKDILRAAKAFPSVKKHKILQEIRSSFRANQLLHEQEAVEKALSLAIKGLSQLSMYSDLRSNQGFSWSVQLEQNPMPVSDPPPEEDSSPFSSRKRPPSTA